MKRTSLSRPRKMSFLTLSALISGFIGALWVTEAVADDLDALSRDDKQWVMPSKNYAQTRFSGLNQINAGNAGKLGVAWSFSVGSNHGQEAAPIVVGAG